jgi:hypothetical protein
MAMVPISELFPLDLIAGTLDQRCVTPGGWSRKVAPTRLWSDVACGVACYPVRENSLPRKSGRGLRFVQF